MMTNKGIKIGLIGFGRMGQTYFKELAKSELWDIAYICDPNPEMQRLAKEKAPQAIVTNDHHVVLADKSVEVVGLFALADSRLELVRLCVESNKHIISEKPIADTLENEWAVVDMVEKANVFSTVNLYLRNSWYHQLMKEFIAEGEIGELAIVRVCHLTPGLAPGEGHEYEGPSFHDCGMHYVDIARWYAESEFKTGHAQAVRMWDYKDPWYLQAHGTFANGIVFDITQGHVYGQLSKDQAHNSYVDLIGTKGVARMKHDFKTAQVELRGVTKTILEERDFGGKNIDVLCYLLAQSIKSNKREANMPLFRDAAIASEYAWHFLDDAKKHDMPSIGDNETLMQIKEYRKTMTNGYGLLHVTPLSK